MAPEALDGKAKPQIGTDMIKQRWMLITFAMISDKNISAGLTGVYLCSAARHEDPSRLVPSLSLV